MYCHVSTSACQRRPCYTVSAERLLVSYFSRTWRRSSTLHCCAVYAPSTPHFKWSDYPRPVSRLCGWKIATRAGSVHLTQTGPLECRPRMPARMRYYSKLELIRPQLHSESCIPFLLVLKYDRSLSRVRKWQKHL